MADWTLTDDDIYVNFGRFKIVLTIKDYETTPTKASDIKVVELGQFKYGQSGGNSYLVGCDGFDFSFYWTDETKAYGYFALMRYLGTKKTYCDVYITPDGTGATWDHWEHGIVDPGSISGEWKSRQINLSVQMGLTRVGTSLTKDIEVNLDDIQLYQYIEECISDDAVARTLIYDDELIQAMVMDDPLVVDVGTMTDVLSLWIHRSLFEITDSPYNTYGDAFKAIMSNLACHVVMVPYLDAYMVSNVPDGSTATVIAEDEIMTLAVKTGTPGENISYKLFTCDQWSYNGNYSYTELNLLGSSDLELTIPIPCFTTDLSADTAAPNSCTTLFEADPGTISYSSVQADSLKRKDKTGVLGTYWSTNFVYMATNIASHVLDLEGSVYTLKLKGIKLGLEAHIEFEDAFANEIFKDRLFRAKTFTYDLAKDVTTVELVEITQ